VTDDARAILEQIGLEEQARLPANRLSPADQKRLEIGVALATRPVLLLLDEPTAGMSPADTAGMVR
jgi:branched-chain amino acid transport system ATP-binding protein